MAKSNPPQLHPDVSKIVIGEPDWNSATVHYPDLVTGRLRLIGRVYKLHGEKWMDGRCQFWTTIHSGKEYQIESAAVTVATYYVRTRRVPRWL
jgi:hypothetical protein